MTDTKRLMGLLPIYVGARVRVVDRLLPPTESNPIGIVPDTPGTVVEIIPHPLEPDILSRPSAALDGFVVLQRLPLAVLVKIDKCDTVFLPEDSAGRSRPGVIAVQPTRKIWQFKDAGARAAPGLKAHTISVARYQVPLAPALPRTLHTLQGITASPGLVAHWKLPPHLPEDEEWLATYVMLSRPPSLAQLLSHGLPRREILERGPPETLQKELEELLYSKIARTRDACAAARKTLGWPARREP